MKYDKNTILVVGHSKPSRDDAIHLMHGEFYISMVIEKDSGKIIDAGCNTILEITGDFVKDLVIGKNLKNDLGTMEKEIKERYFALTQKPLIAGLKDAYNRYMSI